MNLASVAKSSFLQSLVKEIEESSNNVLKTDLSEGTMEKFSDPEGVVVTISEGIADPREGVVVIQEGIVKILDPEGVVVIISEGIADSREELVLIQEGIFE